MAIDWFPGHMLKAKKEVAEGMGKVDVVIEVIDARVPFSSLNPMVEELRKKQQRPALKVLNKTDLADPRRTKQWLDFYNAQPSTKAHNACRSERTLPRAALTSVMPLP